jgi:divalent metal cation (Fe/Co/Zn/Cd) transporter
VQTHDLLDEIESSIRKVLPGTRVLTHPEPAAAAAPT